MAAQFDEHDIRFLYPENWQLETQETDTGWTVSVQSPETAFFLLTVDAGMPSLENVAETALEALRDEYPDLESDERIDSVAGQPSFGYDVRFISMDLTNTCWLRTFFSSEGTVLVLWQLNDLESEYHEQVLRAICASLRVEDD